MSRSELQTITIGLANLHLWQKNPRLLYDQSDEMACITHFVKDQRFIILLEDIAKNGLGLNPIVVIKIDERYVVADGNRRVAALKLLQNPSLCPAGLDGVRNKIKICSQKNSSNIVSEVECFYAEDSTVAMRHLESTHIGEQGGKGQVDWNALMQAAFSYEANIRYQYQNAYKLLMLAHSYGYHFGENYPITTLGRFPIREFCDHYEIHCPEEPNLPMRLDDDQEAAINAVKKLVSDVGEGKITVSTRDGEDSVRSGKTRAEYLEKLKAEFPVKNGTDNNEESKDNGQDAKDQSDSGTGKGGGKKQAQKHSSLRVKFIYARCHTRVPSHYVKENNIFSEMLKLKSKETPITCAVMLRVFFEATVRQTLKAVGTAWADDKSLSNNAKNLANSLLSAGKIDKQLRNSILKFCGEDVQLHNSLFTLNTIQGIVHSEHFHPTQQHVNVLWDILDPFIAKCWETVSQNE